VSSHKKAKLTVKGREEMIRHANGLLLKKLTVTSNGVNGATEPAMNSKLSTELQNAVL